MKRFGEKLTKLLEERCVAKKEIASSLGLHPSAVTRWTNNEGKNPPSADQVMLIAYQFNVQMESLVDDRIAAPLPRSMGGTSADVNASPTLIAIQVLIGMLGEQEALERLAMKSAAVPRVASETSVPLVLEDSTLVPTVPEVLKAKESPPGPPKGSKTRQSRGS